MVQFNLSLVFILVAALFATVLALPVGPVPEKNPFIDKPSRIKPDNLKGVESITLTQFYPNIVVINHDTKEKIEVVRTKVDLSKPTKVPKVPKDTHRTPSTTSGALAAVIAIKKMEKKH